MTKKAHFVLFVAAATAFNMAAAVICFGVFLLLYAILVPHIPAEKTFIGIPLLFIASLALSFFIYRRTLRRYLKKHPFKWA